MAFSRTEIRAPIQRTGDTDLVRTVLSEGKYGGGQHVFHGTRFLLLGKYYGQFQQITYHDGRGNSARLYCNDLVDGGGSEPSDKFHADGFHQDGVHLVINEVVYFQNASGEAFSVFENAVFQSFHVG